MAQVKCSGCGTMYILPTPDGSPVTCHICQKPVVDPQASSTPAAPSASGSPTAWPPGTASQTAPAPNNPAPSNPAPMASPLNPAGGSVPMAGPIHSPAAAPYATPYGTAPAPNSGPGPLPPHLAGAAQQPMAAQPTATGPMPPHLAAAAQQQPTGGPLPPHLAPKSPLPPHLAGTAGATAQPRSEEIQGPKVEGAPERRQVKPGMSSGTQLSYALHGLLVLMVLGSIFLLAVFTGKIRFGGAPPEVEEEVVIIEREPLLDMPLVWTDASQKSLRMERVKVRIERVDYGEVRGKDLRNAVIISGENYLILTVNVQNQGAKPVEYRSWYGGIFPSKEGKRYAQLTDHKGRPYEMIQFGDVTRIKGHTASASLEARDEVEDVMVFVIPPEQKRDLIPYFHLELPAEAVGVEGTYRFKVPRDMIYDFQAGT